MVPPPDPLLPSVASRSCAMPPAGAASGSYDAQFDPPRLRQELNRIRYLLAAPREAAPLAA